MKILYIAFVLQLAVLKIALGTRIVEGYRFLGNVVLFVSSMLEVACVELMKSIIQLCASTFSSWFICHSDVALYAET